MGEKWSDERLDDFRDDVNRRFDDVDKRFDKVEGEIGDLRTEMNTRFDGLQRAFNGLQRTMLLMNGGIIATLLAAVLAAIFGVGQL